jgi:predicted RNase H-like HicB family nuclease
MSNKKEIIFLTGNLIQTESSFIAYFDEYPELFAQGDDAEEAKSRLVKGLATYLKKRRGTQEQPIIKNGQGKVTHFELTAAI